MISIERLSICVGLIFAAAAVQGSVAAQTPQLHFLGIADTEAKGVGEHVEAALSRTTSAMLGQMPSQRRKEHAALIGPQCNIETIKETVQALPVAKGDTVIVYYAGHGAFDKTNGTLFMPERNPGKALRMRSVMEWVKHKEPHLLIMLVDCCQTPVSGDAVKKKQMVYGAPLIENVPPLEQSLYFDAAPGSLILFATERNQAVPCGIPMNGAILPGTLFSEALYQCMREPEIGAVGWKGFAYKVKTKVNELFAEHVRDPQGRLVLSNNQRVAVPHQRVWAQMINPDGEVSTFIEAGQ